MDQSPAASSTPRALHLSTDMFGERQRFDEWRESILLKSVRVDLTTPDRESFRAATRVQLLENLALVASAYSPARVHRTKELMRDGNDSMRLVMIVAGTVSMQFGDQAIRLDANAATLVPANLAGSIGSDGSSATLTVGIPRALLSGIHDYCEASILRPIPANDTALRLLRHYVGGLVSDATLIQDAAGVRLAERQIRELIAHLFDPAAELARAAPAGGLKAARLRAVVAGIEQHLTNPALTAAWLGTKLGLSDRYVQHLLAEHGFSFSELVRRKRAETARQMLERPAATPPRVTDVAFAVGFGDLSGFNRAFRERFGCTPSDVLHRRVLN